MTLRRMVSTAAFLVFSGASLAGGGIAFITDMKGEVALDGARPALLAELGAGQKLALGRGAQVSVMYTASGREYALKGPGAFEVKERGIDGAAAPAPLARDTAWRASSEVLVQVGRTASASVRMRSLAPARTEAPAALAFPSSGAIATLQPTFRWNANDPKKESQFALYVVGEDKAVVTAKSATGRYRPPARLKPDTEYAWTVSVAGDEIGSARFRTLPADAVRRVDERRPADKAAFSDRVLFTLMLHEMGAEQEAREEWGKLAAERADLPELARLSK